MKLTALSFENYKAFSKRESIEVRPLTILIGRNNAGKSAISRLPLLIARALSDSRGDLNGDKARRLTCLDKLIDQIGE
ncbi:MAG: hypothetical protein B6247_25630 [Candidatus Parabeggiatoa sp. nov. 2]|nr:MAG: hypothetical protein B6247_25630 [Beggiatoa sp. 4572_84]